MSRRKTPGLHRGQLETHITAVMVMHFELNKSELKVNSAVFKALKSVCLTEDKKLLDEIKRLSDSLQGDNKLVFNMIVDLFKDPKRHFRAVNLRDADLAEVRYALKNQLFKCMMEFIVSKKVTNNMRDFFSNASVLLKREFEALPTRRITPPDYDAALKYGSHAVMGVPLFIMCLVIIRKIYPAVSHTSAVILNPESSTEQLIGVVALAVLALVSADMVRLVNTVLTRTHMSAYNFFDAMREHVSPVEIQAQPPEDGKSWDKVLEDERQAIKMSTTG